jgi:DNA-nicking Smr family endonuclease
MQRRSRKRLLSQEELELWARVTRRDQRLARSRPARLGGGASLPKSEPEAPAASAAQSEPAQVPPAKPAGKSAIEAKIKPASSVPPPAPFDPRISMRIARGRHEIDARLDLHGLRQQDAHAALRRFLAHAQAQGHRHVLIITGKGKAEPDADHDFWNSQERGVLRRLVPQWLAEPSFRLHVVSFTESALRHGGSGALYVTIRKHPRSKA